MEQKVNVDILNDSQKQALVCMYYVYASQNRCKV